MTLPIPGSNLFKLLGAITALAFVAGLWAPAVLIWQVALIVLGLVALLDLVLLYRKAIPEAKRSVHTSIPLGVKRTVTLQLQNTTKYRSTFDLFDHYPAEIDATGLPLKLSLAPQEAVEVTVRFTSTLTSLPFLI